MDGDAAAAAARASPQPCQLVSSQSTRRAPRVSPPQGPPPHVQLALRGWFAVSSCPPKASSSAKQSRGPSSAALQAQPFKRGPSSAALPGECRHCFLQKLLTLRDCCAATAVTYSSLPPQRRCLWRTTSALCLPCWQLAASRRSCACAAAAAHRVKNWPPKPLPGWPTTAAASPRSLPLRAPPQLCSRRCAAPAAPQTCRRRHVGPCRRWETPWLACPRPR